MPNRFYVPTPTQYTSQFVEKQYPFGEMLALEEKKTQRAENISAGMGELESLLAPLTTPGHFTQEIAGQTKTDLQQKISGFVEQHADDMTSLNTIRDLSKLRGDILNDPRVQAMDLDKSVWSPQWDQVRLNRKTDLDFDPNVDTSTGQVKQWKPGDPFPTIQPLRQYEDWRSEVEERLSKVPFQYENVNNIGFKYILDPTTNQLTKVMETESGRIGRRGENEFKGPSTEIAKDIIEGRTSWADWYNKEYKDRYGKEPTLEGVQQDLMGISRPLWGNEPDTRTSYDIVAGETSGTKGSATAKVPEQVPRELTTAYTQGVVPFEPVAGLTVNKRTGKIGADRDIIKSGSEEKVDKVVTELDAIQDGSKPSSQVMKDFAPMFSGLYKGFKNLVKGLKAIPESFISPYRSNEKKEVKQVEKEKLGEGYHKLRTPLDDNSAELLMENIHLYPEKFNDLNFNFDTKETNAGISYVLKADDKTQVQLMDRLGEIMTFKKDMPIFPEMTGFTEDESKKMAKVIGYDVFTTNTEKGGLNIQMAENIGFNEQVKYYGKYGESSDIKYDINQIKKDEKAGALYPIGTLKMENFYGPEYLVLNPWSKSEKQLKKEVMIVRSNPYFETDPDREQKYMDWANWNYLNRTNPKQIFPLEYVDHRNMDAVGIKTTPERQEYMLATGKEFLYTEYRPELQKYLVAKIRGTKEHPEGEVVSYVNKDGERVDFSSVADTRDEAWYNCSQLIRNASMEAQLETLRKSGMLIE